MAIDFTSPRAARGLDKPLSLTDQRLFAAVRELRTGLLQWAIGGYCATIGALMLVAPHQFSARAFAGPGASLSWWGFGFLAAGLSLLTVATITPGRVIVSVVHVFTGGVLLMLSGGFLVAGSWVIGLAVGLVGVGTLLATLLRRGVGRPWASRGDLLLLLLGLTSALTGLLLLTMPERFTTPRFDAIRPWLNLEAAALLVGGLLLATCQLQPALPPIYRWAAHLTVAAGFLSWLVLVQLPNGLWVGSAYFGGFGVLLAALPWLGGHLARIDAGSLRARLALALAVAAALPLVAAVALEAERDERTMVERVLTMQQLQAVSLSEQVDDYVELHRAALTTLAAVPGLLQLPPERQRALLQTVGESYPDVATFSLFDRDGLPLARTDDGPLESALATPSFEAARRTSHWSAAMLPIPGSENLRLRLGQPILGPSGTFEGYMALDFDSDRLVELLDRVGPSLASGAYLVDATGQLLAQSDLGGARQQADFTLLAPLADVIVGGQVAGTRQYFASGSQQLAGYAPVPALGWSVVVEQPAATALAGIRSDHETSFVLLVLAIAVASGLGAVCAGWLTAPLRTLAKAASQLQAGAGDSALPHSAITEVRELATTFGEMRAHLAVRTAEREQLLTDERSARSAAQAAEALYRGLFHGVADAVLVTASDGHFVDANGPMTDLCQYSREELRQMRVGDLTNNPAWFSVQFELIKHQPQWRGEFDIRRKDGAIVPVESSVGAVSLPTEAVFVTVLRDISERRAVERLQQEFLGLAAHELRNPLAALQGFAQLMRKNSDYSERSIDGIIAQTGRLERLISDLLDASRLESGRIELRRAPVDLVVVARESLEQAQATTQDHALRLEAPARALVGRYDRDRLGQVFQNLLNNAIKFAPGGGEVLVQVEDLQNRALVSVTDCGLGIPPEAVPRVFDRFFRAANAAAGSMQGQGLGLYITRSLVEAHDGRIRVESELGHGSIFTVTLPLDHSNA